MELLAPQEAASPAGCPENRQDLDPAGVRLREARSANGHSPDTWKGEPEVEVKAGLSRETGSLWY